MPAIDITQEQQVYAALALSRLPKHLRIQHAAANRVWHWRVITEQAVPPLVPWYLLLAPPCADLVRRQAHHH